MRRWTKRRARVSEPTPMQMSLDYLRKHGYYADIVEHRPRIFGRPDLKITRDLLGFADILALKDHVLLVQTTSESNVSARVRKVQACEAFEWCKRAGIRIHVHGWGEHGLRVVDMANEAPNWSAILRKKHKKQLVTQEDLKL